MSNKKRIRHKQQLVRLKSLRKTMYYWATYLVKEIVDREINRNKILSKYSSGGFITANGEETFINRNGSVKNINIFPRSAFNTGYEETYINKYDLEKILPAIHRLK